MKRIAGKLSESIGIVKVKVQQLKLQLICEQRAVKDAEAESEILRKRLWMSEENYQRADKMFHDNLIRRKKLEEKIISLKEFLMMASSLKSKKSDPS